MNPIFLYANCQEWQYEKQAVEKYFQTSSNRYSLKKDDLVIGRFSCLPYYKEQEIEYNSIGVQMINSYEQHRYIADLQNWYYDLQEFTPKTYNNLYSLPEDKSFILKGETNSKKFLWNSHMFAKDKQDAIKVHSNLTNDGVIQNQNIYIREYVPLETFTTSYNNLPITNEFRFFIYKKQILSGGFYWSSHINDLPSIPDINQVPISFLNTVIDKIQSTEICEPPNYYVIDVAKTQNGNWIVIELNDGQMSGLSENNPEVLYKELRKWL